MKLFVIMALFLCALPAWAGDQDQEFSSAIVKAPPTLERLCSQFAQFSYVSRVLQDRSAGVVQVFGAYFDDLYRRVVLLGDWVSLTLFALMVLSGALWLYTAYYIALRVTVGAIPGITKALTAFVNAWLKLRYAKALHNAQLRPDQINPFQAAAYQAYIGGMQYVPGANPLIKQESHDTSRTDASSKSDVAA